MNTPKKWIYINGKAVLGTLKAHCYFPKYLKKNDCVVENTNDLNIPEGTVVRWELATKNTKKLKVIWQDKQRILNPVYSDFKQEYRFGGKQKFILTNNQTSRNDTVVTLISVIKDAHPLIEIQEEQDSIYTGRKYFQGHISDDYGLSQLKFVYTIEQQNGQKKTQKLDVESVSGTMKKFDFAVDFSRENYN